MNAPAIIEALREQDRQTTRQQLRAICQHPYVRLPGSPEGHKVVAQLRDGSPVRAEAIEQAFNDMLLTDSLKGAGFFRRHSQRNEELLTIAERLYRMNSQQALVRWLQEPNGPPVEWDHNLVVLA